MERWAGTENQHRLGLGHPLRGLAKKCNRVPLVCVDGAIVIGEVLRGRPLVFERRVSNRFPFELFEENAGRPAQPAFIDGSACIGAGEKAKRFLDSRSFRAGTDRGPVVSVRAPARTSGAPFKASQIQTGGSSTRFVQSSSILGAAYAAGLLSRSLCLAGLPPASPVRTRALG